LVRFVEHRVADRRVVRLIQKWLNAGVLEEGKRVQSDNEVCVAIVEMDLLRNNRRSAVNIPSMRGLG
jgi:hypothetical protein